MIDLYNEKIRLDELQDSIKTSANVLKLENLELEKINLLEEQNKPDFWSNQENAAKVNQSISNIEKTIALVNRLTAKSEAISDLMDLAEETDDEDFVLEIRLALETLEQEVNELYINTLFTGKYDSNNAILSIHAGAGGTEAQDWAEMLYRMYTRFCERQGYAIEILDMQTPDDAGIKSVSFLVKGENVYGLLKNEKGVHRLVRISPFDSNKRRHTSFASLEVMPEINDSQEIVIRPEELRIDTCRSSGAGGQHVNKTESAVRITHLPTGIVTWCQNERSQVQNKATAMKVLISKLTELKEREAEEQNKELKGNIKKIEWGSQIRSYVFCPYTMVKDHRTNFENTNVNQVMDGDIIDFIYDYLAKSSS